MLATMPEVRRREGLPHDPPGSTSSASATGSPLLFICADPPVSVEYADTGEPIPLPARLPAMVGLVDAEEIRLHVTIGEESQVLTASWPRRPTPQPQPATRPRRRAGEHDDRAR